MPHAACLKCGELWRAYGEATRRHVELLKQQELCSQIAPALSKEMDLASVRRDSVRTEIRIHLAVDHVDEPSLTVAV
jgi:hypothetical protein